MKEPSLVVMAAGIGNRFGGFKQIAPIDDKNRTLVDYSLFDAHEAGFRKVIFIITKEIEADFRACIGDAIEPYFDIRYVHQNMDTLPKGYSTPKGRIKPWGTAHAIACAEREINEPFVVINADDYYGPNAFETIYSFFEKESKDNALVTYPLNKTLSKNGGVSRGICQMRHGYLERVKECKQVFPCTDGAIYIENGLPHALTGYETTSMNFWGFQEDFKYAFWDIFPEFLDAILEQDSLRAEYYIQDVVNEYILRDWARFKILYTQDDWYGVTYLQDSKEVYNALNESELYPSNFWV